MLEPLILVVLAHSRNRSGFDIDSLFELIVADTLTRRASAAPSGVMW